MVVELLLSSFPTLPSRTSLRLASDRSEDKIGVDAWGYGKGLRALRDITALLAGHDSTELGLPSLGIGRSCSIIITAGGAVWCIGARHHPERREMEIRCRHTKYIKAEDYEFLVSSLKK